MKIALFAGLATAHALNLRESVKTSMSGNSNPNKNSPICYEILQTQWWTERTTTGMLGVQTQMDAYCKPFVGQANEEICNSASARQAAYDSMGSAAWNAMYYGGSATAQDMTNGLQSACTMVGAKNHTCIGNPCNSLNEGSCMIAQTQGQCVWYTPANVATINAYRAADPSTRWGSTIPGHGCYRNPCNIPGTGKQSNATCVPYSVPELFTCTYCKGANDPQLKGQGMGCQMTSLNSWNTENICAPVRLDSNVPAGSVYGRTVNPTNCQCSARYSQCYYEVFESPDRSNFQPVA